MRHINHDLYREAARRLLKRDDIDIGPHAHVKSMSDGAYVEVVIWIPIELATPCDTCGALATRLERDATERVGPNNQIVCDLGPLKAGCDAHPPPSSLTRTLEEQEPK